METYRYILLAIDSIIMTFEKGYTPWNKGKHHSEKTKQKMSLAHRGLPGHKPNKGSFKKGHVGLTKGRHFSEEIIRNMRGRPPTSGCFKKGHISYHTEESRQKLRIQRLKQVIPCKDTKIEVAIQNGLTNLGIQFRKHEPIIGQPDVFIEPNLCIFADGYYWHNLEKWKKRDKIVNNELISRGYRLLRFSERKYYSCLKHMDRKKRNYYPKHTQFVRQNMVQVRTGSLACVHCSKN